MNPSVHVHTAFSTAKEDSLPGSEFLISVTDTKE
jgi:hypothetical protein